MQGWQKYFISLMKLIQNQIFGTLNNAYKIQKNVPFNFWHCIGDVMVRHAHHKYGRL
jgi:hypothetical protein